MGAGVPEEMTEDTMPQEGAENAQGAEEVEGDSESM